MLTLTARSHCSNPFWKMESSLFIPCLDKLFNLWNNVVHQMNYWVHTAGRYRAISIIGRVHAAFFNCHQFNALTYMPGQIVLARMMTALDLEFEKALHYQNEGFESYKDYHLLPHVMRPVYVFSVFTTEASFNLDEYKETQHIISPFMPR